MEILDSLVRNFVDSRYGIRISRQLIEYIMETAYASPVIRKLKVSWR
jgi:hypothetical protein